MNDAKKAIRKTMRERRRSLSGAAQRKASIALAAHITGHRWFRSARRVALYLSADGEIDPTLCMLSGSISSGCMLPGNTQRQFYTPVIMQLRRPRRLQFAPLSQFDGSATRYTRNRLGIREPMRARQRFLWPTELDLLLLPLVAFDRTGRRLGMGGGYYDRTLSVRQQTGWGFRPYLVGVAHSCQQAENLPNESWDVPLDAIVTDTGWLTPEHDLPSR